MITIKNIDKILSINSQDVEILTFQEHNSLYEFEFVHDNINSAQFKVHMSRYPDSGDSDSYRMKLWDSISSSPFEYNFGLHDVKDPFTLLNYLKEVLYDWDNITNK